MRSGSNVAIAAQPGARPIAPREKWAIAAILLLAALLRVPYLGRVPPPLNQDEASRGYDAWCLWETGADRWAARWPFFLKSFGPGDYTAALSTYLIVPLIPLLGPTPEAMRLPSAILGVATVLALWLWMRRQFEPSVGLLAAQFLATQPWHVSMCRTAHESALVPFFLTCGLMLWSRGRLPPIAGPLDSPSRRSTPPTGRRGLSAFFAGIMLGLCAWVYPASRFLVPIMLLVMLLVAPRAWIALLRTAGGRRAAGAAMIGLMLGTLPVWWTLWRAPEQAAARAQATVLFYAPWSAGHIAREIAWNYAAEFDPRTLIVRGEDISSGDVLEFGRLLHVELPLTLVGLAVLIRQAVRSTAARFLLAWLLLHPLPAAICGGWNPHPMRAVLGAPIWAIVSAMGALTAVRWLARRASGAGDFCDSRARRVVRGCASLGFAALLVNVAWCARGYATDYPDRVADDFQENLTHAMAWAGAHMNAYDVIGVTDVSNQPYIYALLYAPVPPKQWRAARVVVAPWNNRFDHVVRVDKFLFNALDREDRPAVRALAEELASLPKGARCLYIDVPGRGPPGRVVTTFPRRNGDVGLELREFRVGE